MTDGEVDLVFSASYPRRITKDMCAVAKWGAVNIHTGLLPEGRGNNPLNWALVWGKKETGITIHKIVDTFDAGDICLQKRVTIYYDDTIRTLRAEIEDVFPGVIKEFFEDPEYLIQNARQQNQARSTYAQKRYPEDSELNLSAKPEEIYNLFRACDPDEYPAFVMEDGKKRIVKLVTVDGVVSYEN